MLDPTFRPRLQFSNEAAAIGYFEIYGTPPRSAELTVRIEIADSQEGAPLVSSVARLQNTDDPAHRLAFAALPLATIAPGDHLVRAIVIIDGQPAGRIYRTLRKVSP